ncbi:MAG: LamG domain-containing protein [Bryobacteraceae bacterium]
MSLTTAHHSPGSFALRTLRPRHQNGGLAAPLLYAAIAVLTTSSAVRAQCVNPPTGSIVAWYAFNETIPNLSENWATQNTGRWSTSEPTPVPGMVFGALSFNGVDNYLDSNDSVVTNFGPAGSSSTCSGGFFSSCTGDFSFDAWVNIPAYPSLPMTIIDKRAFEVSSPIGYSIYINGSRIGLQLADGTGAVGYDNYDSPNLRKFTLNAWHHIAITVKRTTFIHYYLDGVLVGQAVPAHQGSLSSVSIFRIGANGPSNPSASSFFRGMLDEVDLYNRVLTTAEVQAIYAAGSNGKCSGH